MSEIKCTGIILAKGAPNETSDGRKVMCAIAVTEELGLVRLYPLSVINDKDVRVWSRVQIVASKTKKDTRPESYRLDSIRPIGVIETPQAKADLLDSCCLRSGSVDPIAYQNEARKSICVVRVEGKLGAMMQPRDIDSERMSLSEEDSWIWTQDDYPMKPKVLWKSVQGVEHGTHALGQEVYMGMKNFAATPWKIFDNMSIGDPDFVHWLVLGNMKHQLSTWVCPHIHRLKKTGFVTRSNWLTCDGRDAVWPYSNQEATNAKPVGPQRTFNFTTCDT